MPLPQKGLDSGSPGSSLTWGGTPGGHQPNPHFISWFLHARHSYDWRTRALHPHFNKWKDKAVAPQEAGVPKPERTHARSVLGITGCCYLFAASLEEIYPPGIWVTMYPQKKEPWIIPTVSGSQLNFAFFRTHENKDNHLSFFEKKKSVIRIFLFK